MDCSPPGSSVHETFHVKILEWVTISFSRVSSWPGDLTRVSSISYIVGKFFATEPTKTITWFLLQRLLCILVLPLPLWNSPSELPKRLQPGLKFLPAPGPFRGSHIWSRALLEQTAGILYTQEGLPCNSLSCGTGTAMAPWVFCF